MRRMPPVSPTVQALMLWDLRAVKEIRERSAQHVPRSALTPVAAPASCIHRGWACLILRALLVLIRMSRSIGGSRTVTGTTQ